MRVVSTYTGAGGLDCGFHKVNAEVIAACELDPAACETFSANFPNVPLFRGKVSEAMSAGFFDMHADVVIGGPPCQGFSVAGKMNPSDPRSAEVFEFLKVVKHVRPKAFVMENVKALALLSKWAFVRERLCREAEAAGYSVNMVVLDSSKFGVSQRRERVFFIGISTAHFGKEATQEAATLFLSSLSKLKSQARPIRKVLESFGPAGTQGNSRVCGAKVVFAKSPILRKSPYAGMLFNGAGRPLPLDGSSSTLPASMGGNKTPIIDEAELFEGAESWVESYHQHLMTGGKPYEGVAPKRLRRLTVDECIAIQSFPTNYDFRGSQSAVYKQIGNAVPPKLAAAVARALFETMGKLVIATSSASTRRKSTSG